MGLKLQLEDVALVDAIISPDHAHSVAQQWEAGQGVVILVGLIEEQAQIGEDHPEFLPAITVLELPQQVA